MDSMLADYLTWLRDHGVVASVADDVVRRPDFNGPLTKDDGSPQLFEVNGSPILEFRDLKAVFAADHATADVAAAMERPSVWQDAALVWEVGCGTCILGILAAKAGAEVIASDIDQRAVDLARQTLDHAGVDVDLRLGANADPMVGSTPADMVMANLPHKPNARAGLLPVGQDGGPNGDKHHRRMAQQLRELLPVGARLLTFLHSLPSPALLATYNDGFKLTLLSWKVRWFGPNEYKDLVPSLRERERAGTSYLVHDGDRMGPIACVWMATRV